MSLEKNLPKYLSNYLDKVQNCFPNKQIFDQYIKLSRGSNGHSKMFMLDVMKVILEKAKIKMSRVLDIIKQINSLFFYVEDVIIKIILIIGDADLWNSFL